MNRVARCIHRRLADQMEPTSGRVASHSCSHHNLYFPGDVNDDYKPARHRRWSGRQVWYRSFSDRSPGLSNSDSFRNSQRSHHDSRVCATSPTRLPTCRSRRTSTSVKRKRLQIRAEALNAFNHPYFGAGMGLNPGTAAAPNAAFGLVTTATQQPPRHSIWRQIYLLDFVWSMKRRRASHHQSHH